MSHQIFLRRYKFLLLHIPLILSFIIPIIWYSLLIFVYPCKNILQYLSFQCGVLCYLKNSPTFINFENFTFFIVPIIIIVIVNMTLIDKCSYSKKSNETCTPFWTMAKSFTNDYTINVNSNSIFKYSYSIMYLTYYGNLYTI